MDSVATTKMLKITITTVNNAVNKFMTNKIFMLEIQKLKKHRHIKIVYKNIHRFILLK